MIDGVVNLQAYRFLADVTDNGFCIVTLLFDADQQPFDYRFLAINPAFVRQTGLAHAVGKTARELLPDHPQSWFVTFARILRTGQAESFEEDEEVLGRFYEVHAFPVGKPGQYELAVLFKDLLPRRHAAAALRAGEARLRAFATASGDLVYRMSADWSQLLELDGRSILESAPEADGFWLDRYVPDEDQPQVRGAIKKAIDTQSMFELQLRVRRVDGSIAWYLSRAMPVLSETGEIKEWLGAAMDLTPAKDAAVAQAATTAELRDTGERLRLATDIARLGVFEWNTVTDRLVVNHWFRDMMELPGDGELRGRKFLSRVIHPESRDACRSRISAALDPMSTGFFTLEHRIVTSRGESWIFSSAQVEFEGEGARRRAVRMIGNTLDISVRKRAEQTLRDSEERQVLMLWLSDILQPLSNPEHIMVAGCEVLGRYLGVGRCGYGEIDATGTDFSAIREWTDGALWGKTGTHRVSDFGEELIHRNRDGQLLVINDSTLDSRVHRVEGVTRTLGVARATLAVPLVKEERWAGILYAQHDEPRRWTRDEERLMAEVAERLWIAVGRARTETALQASQQRLQRVLETDTVSVLFFNIDGRLIDANDVFLRTTGYSRTDVDGGGLTWQGMTPPEYHASSQAQMDAFVDSGRIGPYEKEYLRRDGSRSWMLFAGRALGDGTIVELGVDINDRKRTEAALRESEERQRVLLEGIPQLVWRGVDAGRWTWASPQWTQFTGQTEIYSREFGWLQTLHPDDRQRVREIWNGAVGRGEFHAEYRLRRAEDGEYRWFQTQATPVRDDSGRIVEWLGTSTDIHERRSLQERQEVLLTELQHRTFNLMGVIRSMADATLRSSAGLGDFRVKFRDRIDALARTQYLLSRLREGERVTFEEVIRGELNAAGALLQNDGRVTLEGPEGIALRSGTVQTFAMALHELTTNALKYGALSQPNAHLDVRWRVETSGSARPWLHVAWTETAVVMPPAGSKAQGTGQGRTLIEEALPYQLGAKSTYVLGADGVRCTIALPVSRRARIGTERVDD